MSGSDRGPRDREGSGAPAVETEAAMGWPRFVVVLGVAAVVLVAGYLVGGWLGASRGGGNAGQPPVVPAGSVLLASGDVRLDGAPLRSSGQLRAGSRLRVARGRAALRLPQGSTLVAEPTTQLTFTYLSEDQIQVRLIYGSILVAVTRRRPGRRFVVTTVFGRVTVVGTIFGVRAHRAGGEVSAYRGRVRVEHRGRRVEVPAGGRIRLGVFGGKVEPHSDPALARAPVERLLALFGDGAPTGSAVLRLRTRPAGVSAEVDGTPLGVTPLWARLVPGRRRLLLRRSPAPIRREIVLEAGGTVGLDIDVRRRAAPRRRVAPRPGP